MRGDPDVLRLESIASDDHHLSSLHMNTHVSTARSGGSDTGRAELYNRPKPRQRLWVCHHRGEQPKPGVYQHTRRQQRQRSHLPTDRHRKRRPKPCRDCNDRSVTLTAATHTGRQACAHDLERSPCGRRDSRWSLWRRGGRHVHGCGQCSPQLALPTRAPAMDLHNNDNSSSSSVHVLAVPVHWFVYQSICRRGGDWMCGCSREGACTGWRSVRYLAPSKHQRV